MTVEILKLPNYQVTQLPNLHHLKRAYQGKSGCLAKKLEKGKRDATS